MIGGLTNFFNYSINEEQTLIVLNEAIKRLNKEWIFKISNNEYALGNSRLNVSVINIEDTIWYKIKRMIGIK